eukprot:2650483-Prymnesium_polylepis.1
MFGLNAPSAHNHGSWRMMVLGPAVSGVVWVRRGRARRVRAMMRRPASSRRAAPPERQPPEANDLPVALAVAADGEQRRRQREGSVL